MVKSSKYDALSSTRTFLTVEKWVRDNIEGYELVKSVFVQLLARQSEYYFYSWKRGVRTLDHFR